MKSESARLRGCSRIYSIWSKAWTMISKNGTARRSTPVAAVAARSISGLLPSRDIFFACCVNWISGLGNKTKKNRRPKVESSEVRILSSRYLTFLYRL